MDIKGYGLSGNTGSPAYARFAFVSKELWFKEVRTSRFF